MSLRATYIAFLAVACFASVAHSTCSPGQFQGFLVSATSGTDTWCTRMDNSVSNPPDPSQVSLTSCCGNCAVGYMNPTGTGACTACAPGSAQSQPGQADCTPCAPGSFTDYSGSPTCHPCPVGTITPTNSSSSCFVCPLNSEPNYFRTQCVCRAGYYMTPASQCTPCPEGANCQSPGNTYDTLVAAAGYWKVDEYFSKCPIPQACLGNNFCAPGYRGFECHSCSGNHGWSEIELKQQCSYCDSSRFAIITAATVGSCVIAAGVAIWVAITYSTHPRLYFIVPLTIFLSMAQVNFLVATKPSAYSDWFSDYFLLYCRYVSSIRPTILELHCLFNDTVPHSIYIQGIYMLFLPPLIALLATIMASYYLSRNPVQYRIGNQSYPTPGFGGIFATACSCVWFILYPDAMWQAFMMWDCKRVVDVRVLFYDSSIICTKTSYYVASYMLGIPLMLCLPLMHLLTALSKKSLRQAAILLSQGYKESHYLWYWLVFIRKGAIAGIMAFVEHENHRLLGVCMVILFALCFQGYFHPYVHDGHNLLEICALALLFVQFYFRIFFFSSLTESTVREGMSYTIAAFIILFFILLIVFIFRYWRKYTQEIEEEAKMAEDVEMVQGQTVVRKDEDDSSDDDDGPAGSKLSSGTTGTGGQSATEESTSRIPTQSRRSVKGLPSDILEATEPSQHEKQYKHKIVLHL